MSKAKKLLEKLSKSEAVELSQKDQKIAQDLYKALSALNKQTTVLPESDDLLSVVHKVNSFVMQASKELFPMVK